MSPASTSATESPPRRLLRRFALAAIITNIGIVFTGGVVRITGSGLGCSDWPTCDGGNITPMGGQHEGFTAAIEFGNRLLTFVVLAAAVAVIVQARRTGPHPPPVMRLAWALPAGVLAQAMLGGITVLTGLSPYTVAAHFLVSMALIAVAVAFHERIRDPHAPPPAAPARGVQHATTALAIVAALVLVLGTVVTGAGPHGGDLTAPRFDVDIRLAAIAHADLVWLLVGLTIATVAVSWGNGPSRFRTAVVALLVIEVAQGGVGYAQYALGIPPTLVSIHVLGASVLWAVVTAVWMRARPTSVTGDGSAAVSAPGTGATGVDDLVVR